MKFIIGLGNPGKKYEATRHNVGFMAIDNLKEKYRFPGFEANKKFNAEISKGKIKKNEVMLVKPQTFINLSGDSVVNIMNFYKLSPEDIIIIHDDIDIDLGKYKTATDSSSAGHNGVQNIIEHLGTKKFTRIRIGIKNDSLRSMIDPADFVLQEFSGQEAAAVKEVLEEALEEIEQFI